MIAYWLKREMLDGACADRTRRRESSSTRRACRLKRRAMRAYFPLPSAFASVGLSSCLAARASTACRSSDGMRSAISGSLPFPRGPGFLGITDEVFLQPVSRIAWAATATRRKSPPQRRGRIPWPVRCLYA
jgi:hypothetical protein